MNLPKLDRPSSTVLVGDKKFIVYPYTLKEQKALAIASKSESADDILRAMGAVIKTCSDADVDTLSTAEFQALFLEIRKMSSGNTIDIILTCEECKTEYPTKLDLDEFQVTERKDSENKIMVGDIGIQLKEPYMVSIIDSKQSSVEQVIDFIFDKENVYRLSDYSEEEVQDYIDSLPSNVVEKMTEYMDSIPKLELHKEWKCPHCEHNNTLDVRGLGAFFG